MITIQGLLRWLLDFGDPIKCTNEDEVGEAGNTKFYAKLFLQEVSCESPRLSPANPCSSFDFSTICFVKT